MFAQMLLGTLPKMPQLTPSVINRIAGQDEEREHKRSPVVAESNKIRGQETRKRILDCIKRHGPIRAYQICERTKIPESTAKRWLEEMLQSGDVFNVGANAVKVYSAAKSAEPVVTKSPPSFAVVRNFLASQTTPMCVTAISAATGVSTAQVRRFLKSVDCHKTEIRENITGKLSVKPGYLLR